MNEGLTLVAATLLLVPLTSLASTQDSVRYNAPNHDDDVRIVYRGLDISGGALQLRYEIQNQSAHDVWICESVDVNKAFAVEVLLREDHATLVIRRRLDVPMALFKNPTTARYLRLPRGEVRPELLSLPLPVWQRPIYGSASPTDVQSHASRLIVQIGYYDGNLPENTLDTLQGIEQMLSVGSEGTANLALNVLQILQYLEAMPGVRSPETVGQLQAGLGGPKDFMRTNTQVRDREEEVLIGYTSQALKGERYVQLSIEDIRIDCQSILGWLSPPDLSACTRFEFRFRPSALEFYFPHTEPRTLLSAEEIEFLRSLTVLSVEDAQLINAFAADIRRLRDHVFLSEAVVADVNCYVHDDRVASFRLDNSGCLLTQEGHVFTYFTPGYNEMLACLRRLTPEIRSVAMRIECAEHLRHLWRWLNLYSSDPQHEAPKYPTPAKWCDTILRYCGNGTNAAIAQLLRCPGAVTDTCHHALNWYCEPHSPGDTVLLFETKAGWNQYGGPELFTFDNHDPQGGCVLLNDGTVKFIRTKEELAQLRWKP